MYFCMEGKSIQMRDSIQKQKVKKQRRKPFSMLDTVLMAEIPGLRYSTGGFRR